MKFVLAISFMMIALPEIGGWGRIQKGCFVSSISQEHGIVKASGILFDKISRGNLLMILPVHSCLSAILLKHDMLIV